MAIRQKSLASIPIIVNIEPMRRKHLRSVVRIERAVYKRPWSAALFAEELVRRSDRTYLVAKVGRHLVGYAGILMQADAAHISTISVAPNWQQMGIATRLMVSLAKESIQLGATGMTLEVRMSNQAAQEMYRKFGFRIEGVRKGYYQTENEDAIVMWAHDVQGPDFNEVIAHFEKKYAGSTNVEIR